MRYIIMCGGVYRGWEIPKQLTDINGETVVERTIRLLRENNITDIAISSNNPAFEGLGVPVLHHENNYNTWAYNQSTGYWCEAFYPTEEPTCYIFGDVVFTEDAIQTIINTETDDIEFFASAPPFNRYYPKSSAEPFALKVVNTEHLRKAIIACKLCADYGYFKRKPIMWELWQIIKYTPLNIIDYTNYTVINDYTSDIDGPGDIEFFRRVLG